MIYCIELKGVGMAAMRQCIAELFGFFTNMNHLNRPLTTSENMNKCYKLNKL